MQTAVLPSYAKVALIQLLAIIRINNQYRQGPKGNIKVTFHTVLKRSMCKSAFYFIEEFTAVFQDLLHTMLGQHIPLGAYM